MTEHKVGDATITHVGGGYYDVAHPNLAEPRRIRGKEEADAFALQLGAASDAEGHMEPQASLPPETPVATVNISEEAPPPPPAAAIPGIIPKVFEGPLPDEAKKALKKAGLGYRRIWLEESDEIPPTGLFIQHNGRSYMISPGREVDVPDFLLGVLNDAVMSSPVLDQRTRKVIGYRDRMRYPYRTLD